MPLSNDSPEDLFAPVLTQSELAEISTRKMPVSPLPAATKGSERTVADETARGVSAALPLGEVTETPSPGRSVHPVRAMGTRWFTALLKILPVYMAIHVALLGISSLAFLYINRDFSQIIMPVATLWNQWNHWDTGHYTQIALHGYVTQQDIAFYPLYPLLLRAGMVFNGGNPFTAGLVISNVAELVMCVVLYRLIERDFDGDRAFHTVLYFVIFPSAFFFSMVYTEATFLCFSTLTFYQMRRQRWATAALFGFLACLTRPDGMFLAIPFCYEYLSTKWPQGISSLRAFLKPQPILTLVKSIRFPILFALCIPLGVVCVMLYGRLHYGDFLAFFHAHDTWGRQMVIPGYGMLKAAWAMHSRGLLNFTTMRTAIDLGADLFIGLLILLCFVGKWRLPTRLWSYALYALTIYLYLQIFMKSGLFPLESMSRFLLEIFPAFLLLSQFRKNQLIHLSYVALALTIFFFLASQFATGHWVL